jgi:hypothetical protein
VLGDELVGLPEASAPLRGDDPSDLPGAPVADHQIQGSPGRRNGAHFGERPVGMRRVMDDAERLDEVVRVAVEDGRQLFRVLRSRCATHLENALVAPALGFIGGPRVRRGGSVAAGTMGAS